MASRRPEVEGQVQLFEPHDKPPARRVVSIGSDKPSWTKYATAKAKKPHRCDFCMANMVDNPSAPASRLARYKRTVRGSNPSILYLCGPHANQQRTVDGIKPIQERS